MGRGPRRPRVGDAAGWREASIRYGPDTYINDVLTQVTVEEPTALTVTNTENEWRFSYVSERVVLRNWFRLRAPGQRTKYFYGETAHSDVLREAEDLDRKIEWEANGWS